jgi:ATP/maltotriose-dependent transcriptional regulator MalT
MSGTVVPSKPNFELVPLLPFARNPRFSGREAELRRLEEIIMDDKRERRLAVLYGLGGMGKTDIVLEFIYRSLHKYAAILWIRAATKDTTTNSFIELAR